MKLLLIIPLLYFISGCSEVSECTIISPEITPTKQVNTILKPELSQEEIESGGTVIVEKPTNEEVAKTLKSLYLAGVAIDGYVSGANVKISGKSIKTDSDGKWVLEYKEDDNLSLGEVAISGGIDASTGEIFEGELKVFVDENDVAEEGEELKSVPATPLTTIVTAIVSSGVDKKEAEQQLATSLGISPESFGKDPIDTLKNGSSEEKKEAAKSIKKALVIQKFAESMTKTVVGDSSSEESKLSAFSSVMSAVASKIAEQSDSEDIVSFDAIMEDTDAIAEATVKNLVKQAESGDLEMEIDLEATTNKLKAAGEIAKSITVMINMIDEDALASGDGDSTDTMLESTFKATEIATLKLEEKLEIMATADASELEALVEDAKKVTDSLIMMGGISSISNKVADAIVSANIGEDGDAQKTVDASDFANFISDDVIEEQSKIFRELEAMDIPLDMILKVAIKKDSVSDGESEEEFSILDSLQEIAQEDDSVEVVDFEALSQNLVQLEEKMKDADKKLSESVESSKAQAIIEVVIPKEKEPEIKPLPEEKEPEIITEPIPEEKEPEVITEPIPEEKEPETVILEKKPIVVVPVDSDAIAFSKVYFGGLDLIGELLEKEVVYGEFDLIEYQNIGDKDISEYSTNIDKNLFTSVIPLKNISLENESKNIAIAFRVQKVDTSEVFLSIFSKVTLLQNNSNFSLNLENSDLEIFNIAKNGLTSSDIISDIEKYIEITDNNLTIFSSQLFNSGFITNNKYEVTVGISSNMNYILNSQDIASKVSENFSAGYLSKIESLINISTSGIIGELNIIDGEIDTNVAPPKPPAINTGSSIW